MEEDKTNWRTMVETENALRDHLRTFKQFIPPFDPVLSSLFKKALMMEVPLYYAVVPPEALQPFDPDYRPDQTPDGADVVTEITEQLAEGLYPPLYVYRRDDRFIVSEDFLIFLGYINSGAREIPCWIIGEPNLEGVTDIKGPVPDTHIRRAFGLES